MTDFSQCLPSELQPMSKVNARIPSCDPRYEMLAAYITLRQKCTTIINNHNYHNFHRAVIFSYPQSYDNITEFNDDTNVRGIWLCISVSDDNREIRLSWLTFINISPAIDLINYDYNFVIRDNKPAMELFLSNYDKISHLPATNYGMQFSNGQLITIDRSTNAKDLICPRDGMFECRHHTSILNPIKYPYSYALGKSKSEFNAIDWFNACLEHVKWHMYCN